MNNRSANEIHFVIYECFLVAFMIFKVKENGNKVRSNISMIRCITVDTTNLILFETGTGKNLDSRIMDPDM